MNHKDHEAIARIIAEQREFESSFIRYARTLYDLEAKLVDYIATTSPRFDRSRFLKACYGEK